MVLLHGIPVKKQFGQHFLRKSSVVVDMCKNVALNGNSSVLEIGCGDGFLTKEIMSHPITRLWVFEIDPEWATYVRAAIPDTRLTIYQENILDLDFKRLEPHAPWIVLANLPYQVTFPILQRLQEHRALLQEGVIMVQEEVAQKIVQKSGRGYGFISLFYQHYFDWKLLEKVPPTAFVPPPQVFSRLLHFKPKKDVIPIVNEEKFWIFIKSCFKQPRRTLRNNLLPFSHLALSKIPEKTLQLRAQQMSFNDFLEVWALFQV